MENIVNNYEYTGMLLNLQTLSLFYIYKIKKQLFV